MFYYIYDTIIGRLKIEEEDKKIVTIQILRQNEDVLKETIRKETKLIKKAMNEIDEYLTGKREYFDIPIKLRGTNFQKIVWKELQKIPYGETCTYLDIAKKIGNDKASRAVGMANNKNKLMIVIPCHRVIGSNKKLVGYAGGLEVKAKLLELEKRFKRKIKNEKI